MNIPILTYHSLNMSGNTYATNDHHALASDLRTLTEDGWKIVPLGKVVDWQQQRCELPYPKTVALSLDDGSDFDYLDIEHQTLGLQVSMFNLLKDFRASEAGNEQSDLHCTTFVIASPEARQQLDQRALIGKGWWNDHWWAEAHQSGLMDVESHSWDHVHPMIDSVAQKDQVRANFAAVDTAGECHDQFVKPSDYIQKQLGGIRPRFFAYPWGQSSDYVANEYLPQNQGEHGLTAAFTSAPRPVSRDDSIWRLPRFVCGRDWRSQEDLRKVLAESF